MIYLISDTHFCHDKDFIYAARGFSSIEEHDEAIVERWNSVVKPEDTVYHLGDVMLYDNDKGIEYINRLNGNIIGIYGNHDTSRRIERLAKDTQMCFEKYATVIKYRKIQFYLSHYPTMTANNEDTKALRAHIINLYGHTHSKDKFYGGNPYMFNCALDAHNCYPVSIEEAIETIRQAVW